MPKLKPTAAKPPIYRLAVQDAALVVWKKFDGTVKEPLRRQLKKRLEVPRVEGAQLHGDQTDCYKIKLRPQGFRLVYQVHDQRQLVLINSVGAQCTRRQSSG